MQIELKKQVNALLGIVNGLQERIARLEQIIDDANLPDQQRGLTTHEAVTGHTRSCPNCGNGYVVQRGSEPWKCSKCGLPEQV